MDAIVGESFVSQTNSGGADRSSGLLDADGEGNRNRRGRRTKPANGQPETTYGVCSFEDNCKPCYTHTYQGPTPTN